MLMRRGIMYGLSLVAAMMMAESAWATVDNLKSYKQAYPGKEPKAYSCKVCHQGAIGKKDDLNAYGQALQKVKVHVDPKKLTVEGYRAIEAEDADGDGVSNLDEIKAGTSPGNPASVPAGTTTAKSKSATGTPGVK